MIYYAIYRLYCVSLNDTQWYESIPFYEARCWSQSHMHRVPTSKLRIRCIRTNAASRSDEPASVRYHMSYSICVWHSDYILVICAILVYDDCVLCFSLQSVLFYEMTKHCIDLIKSVMKYKLLSHLNTVLFSNLLKNNRKVVLLINKVDAATLKENKHE